MASEPPMVPSSPEATTPAAPQEYCATLHHITTSSSSSLLPSVAVSIWVEYSFEAGGGARLSPLSQRKGPLNSMAFEAGYGRQLIRYLKSPIQPGEDDDRPAKIKTCLLVEEAEDGNGTAAARIDVSISET